MTPDPAATPDILARITLFSGHNLKPGQCARKQRTLAEWRCIMIADENWACRIYMDNQGIGPGETRNVAMRFLLPHFVVPQLRRGTKFELWECGIVGEGEVLEVVPREKRWPYFTIAREGGTLDEEEAGVIAQAAADAGALGTELSAAGALRVYLPADCDLPVRTAAFAAVAEAGAMLGLAAPLDVGLSLPDTAWATAWKAHFRSFALGENFVIRPDWELNQPAPAGLEGRKPIFLLPGQAFGTGTHETTRLALGLLEKHVKPGDRVLDFGAGSAILSIAAALLGAGEVIGIEHDPDALPNARENLALNGLAQRVKIMLADVPEAAPGRFNLIICNILPQYALTHMPALRRALDSSDSLLIYSGYLADEIVGIESTLEAAGLRTLTTHQDGLGDSTWGGLVARPA